jgi:transcriptional regulator with XRE-family HTH domain
MARDTLTGSRIRERRIAAGIKQADLARQAGISASYLNLIEHNRRRIGGKLLREIAGVLKTEPAALSEGAGAALIAALREAAGAHLTVAAEVERVDEFAGRFPGWARLLADTRARVAALEGTVETLTDRMTHDPHLATSLHEMLTTVTAIRSAAAILAEPGDLAPEWEARFQRNLDEDSARLADTARALVNYLETDGENARDIGSPQEEANAAWDAVGHHLPQLEAGGAPEAALAAMGEGLSAGARAILNDQLRRYSEDAKALPIGPLLAAVETHGPDPAQLSQALAVDPALVMRRLAALPPDHPAGPIGLLTCDASGVLITRKPVPGFAVPRVGAGCPLWPLYRALSRPYAILSGPVRPVSGDGRILWTDALALPRGAPAVNRDPAFEAQMLIRPALPEHAQAPVEPVGSACRVCPRHDCQSRREPSIVSETPGDGGF